jgi:hypothetical protein
MEVPAMEEIVPRFEFRAFAQDFGVVEETMRTLSPEARFRESLEVYILSAGNDQNNTKVRASLMDIKTRLRSERGCEQWSPRMKGEFPMAADILLGEVFPAFAVPAPKLGRETYTLQEFLDELVAPNPDLQAASVHKRRYGYEVMGCMAEVAEVLVNGARIKTASLESADLDALEAARSRTRLDAYENVNYLVAIKRVIGMAPLPRDTYYRAV